MKKILITLFILVVYSNARGQTWAAPGATWYYDVAANFYSIGYVKITKTGDTLIQGHLCDVLEKRATGYNISGPFPMYFDQVYAHEYTYTANNIVYHWRNNMFYILYDFNAAGGTGWTVAASPFGYGNGTCDTAGHVTVVQTGVATIAGQNLAFVDVVADSLSMYGFSNVVSRTYQIIGNTSSFIPDILTCIADANEMSGLRCYSDSTGFSYVTGIVPYCNFITGIENVESIFLQSVFPNPFINELIIHLSQLNADAQLTLTDVYGKQVLQQTIPKQTLNIKLQTLNLCKGVYFLQVQADDHTYKQKVIKQ